MKTFFYLIAVVTLFLTTSLVAQPTNSQCYLCHSNTSLQKQITTSAGVEIIPLYVNATKYDQSLHHALECVNCHTDITTENLYNHQLTKFYGGWARFSVKNDTVTAGQEKTRNYTTAASMSCNKNGCHPTQAAFDSSAHFLTFKQKHASLRTVNGELVGEAYVNNDCNRCHTTCATCHFGSMKKQFLEGDILTIWDSLIVFGDGTEPLKSKSNNLTQVAMDWTTNVESHTFLTGDSLRANNNVCRSCHLGYYKPPMNGFLSTLPPYPKADGRNIRRHPQTQETTLSDAHNNQKCANCHTDVHSYPGTRAFNWQVEGDVNCQTCHTSPNHTSFVAYSQHTTVDCISCHFRGFVKSTGQIGHDVWRLENEPTGRVRPLAVKYNEAVSWYPHNIEKPDLTTSCGTKCHYAGNLLGTSVVPVELTSFTAQAENQKVILRWITATELNNSGFEIQRGVEKNNYATIGFVRGKGTTTNQNEYTYTDKDLVDAKYYYRLKQVDFNGVYEFSDIIEVDVRSLDEYVLEQNYPNPFNPSTTIGYILKEKCNAKLTLLNGIGEEIVVLKNSEQEKGYHKVEFNAVNLPSGIYFYQLKTGTFTAVKKMLLIK